MQIHELTQGSPEWHAHRVSHFNASDAPAMMGFSAYKTRTQLLHERHTGISPDVDPSTQRRFDDGHRFEALARPLAEEFIGESLYPVTGSQGKYSASYDGLTMAEDIAFEHKSLNNELRAIMVDGCTGADLAPMYQIQMEQQCLVSGAERVLFMASKWDGEELIEERHCWYTANPECRKDLLQGWAQFEIDLAAYVPTEVLPAIVATAVNSLPAVSVRMDGSLTVISNLPDFSHALRAFIERIPAKPSTDQEFADTEAACKSLKKAEEALEAAENNALSGMSSVEEMRRVVADCRELARSTRLSKEKDVDARKVQIRTEQVQRGKDAFAEHMAGLNTRLGKPYMPTVATDFPGVIKGKKTVTSLKDAVDGELANAKIAASAIADKIQTNLNTLWELAANHAFLFADAAQIVLKAPDDFTALVKLRIAEHQVAEQKKEDEQRDRIRAEEVARMDREQAERDRICEAAAKASAEAIAKAQAAVEVLAQQKALDEIVAANALVQGNIETARQADAMPELLLNELSNVANSLAADSMAEHAITAASRKAATPPDLRLGQISTRLGFPGCPLNITADFLRTMGFEPAGRDRAAVLYHEDSFRFICDALVKHIRSVCELAA